MGGPRTAQRLLGDIHGQHVRAPAHDLGGEGPLAAAQIEHARARGDRLQQEAQPQLEIGRLEPGRHRAPELFVVGTRRHRINGWS